MLILIKIKREKRPKVSDLFVYQKNVSALKRNLVQWSPGDVGDPSLDWRTPEEHVGQC